VLDGSPGQADPAPPDFPGVVVSEALTHTDPPQVDFVELANPTGSTADISGWFLSDDPDDPKKYRFTDGTTIAPGGFIVRTETDFNANPNSPSSFGLDSHGDAIYLFSADSNSNLTGYMHGYRYGAAANGVSFGRHLTSSGEDHFVAQTALTEGAANLAPRVGPIVINEIMFRPPPVGPTNNTIDEFIELRNTTSQAVPLFDPAAATNHWQINGGVQFTFPADLTLPGDGYLVLVNFDPADANALASFRSRYSISSGTTILGPYTGSLDNLGAPINLFRPDVPEPASDPDAGLVPFILVDRVRYSNSAPWPVGADGTGFSLQRVTSGDYGDDPVNWTTASPTAGRVNAILEPDADDDGLPDAWESAHNLDPSSAVEENGPEGDPDEDGFANIEEYLSGTNPRDSASFLRIDSVRITSGQRIIRFPTVAGRSYTVQYAEALKEGPWLPLANLPVQSANGMMDIVDPMPTSPETRFYRIVTPATP
jgi:hypothetical protein